MLKIENFDMDEFGYMYIITSVSSFLYMQFSENETLINEVSKSTTPELIEQFKTLASTDINTYRELTFVYMVYIGIMIKNDEFSDEFFNSEASDIKFDFFPGLRRRYFEKIKNKA